MERNNFQNNNEMKRNKTHIQLTIKEAQRIMECLETLEAGGENCEYDIDVELDENVKEYNSQCRDAGKLSRRLFDLIAKEESK